VLCIRRTLAQGRLAGLLSGLGAATADALYGAVAAFGLTLVTQLLVGQQNWIRLTGGVFLCYLGVKTFLARPAEQAAPARSASLAGAYASTLALTLSNPMTILSFSAIFAGIGIGMGTGSGGGAAALLVAGVFAGSAAWWLLLSAGVGLLRARIGPRALRWINRISGAIVFAFGVIALAGVIT
jgi:threonine/homoserine/homoserine lactone efflux protein